MYELIVRTPLKRDWRTLWLIKTYDEYILTKEDIDLSELMYMINEFEKYDCEVQVVET